jgi:hypothetical protein
MSDARLTVCSSCRAKIIWLRTTAGNHMPTDFENVEPEDRIFDPKKHVSHFATCRMADKHRRPTRSKL